MVSMSSADTMSLKKRTTAVPENIDEKMIVVSPEHSRASSMPITVTEDMDSDDSGRSGSASRSMRYSKRVKPRRCVSLPCFHKSIMKRRTLDESLHSAYGSEDGRNAKFLSLQFDKVNIREYSRTVGDNPSCSSGPPVSISWEYNIIGDFDVDGYERSRPPRRIQEEMVLPRGLREDLLRYEWNISRKEIVEAVRAIVKIKNQRKTTINNLGKAEKLEEAMESATRKLKRFLSGQKPIHKQVIEMEREIEAANRRRSKLLFLEENMSDGGEECTRVEKLSGRNYAEDPNDTCNASDSS